MGQPKSKLKPLIDLHRDVGLRFGMLRRLDKFKQSDVAEWLGLTREMVSNIESGRVILKLETAWKFSKIMLMHPDFLMYGKQKSFPELRPKMENWIDDFCNRHGAVPFGDSWPSIAWVTAVPLEQQEGVISKLLSGSPNLVAEVNFESSDAPQIKGEAMLDISPVVKDDSVVRKQIRSLPQLLDELRNLTKDRGGKLALAKKMQVSRQAVDQWLSTDTEKATKPTAEMTFELISWVEDQRKRTK